jgi:hypothetical protein
LRAGGPLAAVLVPTHEHPETLDLAVRSALEQTIEEIEVVVIGDGVGEETREVVAGLRREDSRVRFLDLPKGPNHGEVHRGTAIDETDAEFVCYLCDDDLLLPGHVESMAEALEDADLAHSRNGRLDDRGAWHPYPADLGSEHCREWVLRPDRNVVSLTGTAHTVAAYRRLPHGWRTTPEGRWPDHYMWQQFLAQPWVRAATATRVTALQLPSHLEGRADRPPEQRRDELEALRASLATAEGRERFEKRVLRDTLDHAAEEYLRRDEFQERLVFAEARLRETETLLTETGARLTEAMTHLAETEERRAEAEASLLAVGETRTWRLRGRLLRIAPLRALARATGRDRDP